MANLWILNQFNGYNSTEASAMKVYIHQHIIIICIYIKFHEILFSGY